MVAAATRYRWLRHAATQLERAHRALPRRQRRRSPTNPPPEPNRREPEECGSRQRVECISERTALGPMLAQHERALGAVGADAGACAIAARTAAMASCVRSAPSHLREKVCVVTPVKRSSRRGRSIAPAGCAARISAPRGSAPAGVRAPARTPAIGSLPAPWTRCGTRRVRAALHRLKAAGGAHLILSRILLFISRAYPGAQPQPLAVLSPTFLYGEIR